MYYVGIDPGNTGAMAVLTPHTARVIDFTDPSFFDKLKNSAEYAHCMVEKVHAMPKQGVTSVFTFGTAYGKALGMLIVLKVPYTLVTPQKWQKVFGISGRKGCTKKQSLERARALFPGLAASHLARKKDHNRADALLIAEYCRREMSQFEQKEEIDLSFMS